MVRDIDNYLGLTVVHEQWLIQQAIAAHEDNLSVRGFAERVGLAKTTAHRVLRRAYAKGAAVVEELAL
jgi:lambda repressor-like predicted transcriptional regulator